MRKPRTKLQVSTFPFLAVLLCAMGSLLLLLFVMDRRAKIAAHYRVAEELKARKERTKAEEDARQAAWEKAKQALHQTLLEQQNELTAQSETMKKNLADARKKLELGQLRFSDIEDHIRNEAGKIALLQLVIDNQRAGITQTDRKETMTKAELAEATKELAELELAFRQMKALKQREKDTYSVVPYRGKRGDSRAPIYIECVRGGILIHPDKKLLQSWDLSTHEALQGEIERRHGPLAIQRTPKKGAPATDEPLGPYVLFLVRPAGISSYYQAMSALKGFQLDFGYELVNEDWKLDFSDTAFAKSGGTNRPRQPWQHKDEIRPVFLPPPPGVAVSKEGSGGVPSFPIQPPTSSNYGPPGVGPGGNSGRPTGNTGFPGGVGLPPSLVVDTGIPKTPSFVPIGRNAPPIAIASSSGSPYLPGAGPGGSGSGYPFPSGRTPGVGALAGSGQNSGSPVGIGLTPGAQGAAPGQNPGSPRVNGQGTGQSPGSPGVNGQGAGQSPGSPGVNGQGAGQSPGSPGVNGQNPGSPGVNGQGSVQNPGAPRVNGQGAGQTPGSPGVNGQGSGQNPGSPGVNGQGAGQSPGAGAAGSPGQARGAAGTVNPMGNAGARNQGGPRGPGAGGGTQGEPGEPGDPTQRGLPVIGAEPAKRRPPPSPLSRLLGNKDFIIILDCRNDSVAVTPGGYTYRWTTSNIKTTDDALVETVKNLIARRQASVRAGEPPYRPIVRFQVPNEGLRMYYHVYPLLQSLPIAAMTRENIVE